MEVLQFRTFVYLLHCEIAVVEAQKKENETVYFEFPAFPKHVDGQPLPPLHIEHYCPTNFTVRARNAGKHISIVEDNNSGLVPSWEVTRYFCSEPVYERMIKCNSVPFHLPYNGNSDEKSTYKTVDGFQLVVQSKPKLRKNRFSFSWLPSSLLAL